MSKCNYWRNQTRGAEFQDGDRSCVSSATLKVGPVVANVYHTYLGLTELWGLAELLAANVFLTCKWILVLLYPGLYCSKKNVCLIAAIIVWSAETCSDWFAVQLFRIHFSGWYHILCARVTILQLWNKFKWSCKKPIAYLLPPPGLTWQFPSELQDLNSKRHLNSSLMLTLLCCPVQNTIGAASWQRGVRQCWGCTGFSPQLCSSMGYFITLQSLRELTLARCFQSWLHSGRSVPSGAEMGFLISNCCHIFPFSCPFSAM